MHTLHTLHMLTHYTCTHTTHAHTLHMHTHYTCSHIQMQPSAFGNLKTVGYPLLGHTHTTQTTIWVWEWTTCVPPAMVLTSPPPNGATNGAYPISPCEGGRDLPSPPSSPPLLTHFPSLPTVTALSPSLLPSKASILLTHPPSKGEERREGRGGEERGGEERGGEGRRGEGRRGEGRRGEVYNVDIAMCSVQAGPFIAM